MPKVDVRYMNAKKGERKMGDLCYVVDKTINDKCSNCGECCSNLLPLSDAEIRRVHAFVKNNKIKEQRHNAQTGVDMTCPFRDEANRKCLIYEVRPQICREFLCNQSKKDIIKKRDSIQQANKITLMRHEFFGSTEDSDWFRTVLLAVGGAL